MFCIQEGKKREIGVAKSIMACVFLTPVIGYFIIKSSLKLDTKGCTWCGNKYNEAEYCGICKKDEQGELRPS